MEWFTLVMLFSMGLCAGSFVNMLVYRTAVKYELIKIKKRVLGERSVCDYCGRQLGWSDNIPVISWLVLGGHSRCCHKKLPLLYPIVELSTGILFVMSFVILNEVKELAIGGSEILLTLRLARVIASLVVITMMVFSTVFDLKYMILPDFATIVMGVGALILGGTQGVAAALVASGFLGVLFLVTRGRGLGLGDVKLAVVMGLLLGLTRVIVAFYVAFIVGAIVGGGLLLSHRVTRKSKIPFGPFLILGTLVSWWYGNSLWYIVFSR